MLLDKEKEGDKNLTRSQLEERASMDWNPPELRELEVKTDSDDDESDDEIEVKIDIPPRNGMGRRSRSGSPKNNSL